MGRENIKTLEVKTEDDAKATRLAQAEFGYSLVQQRVISSGFELTFRKKIPNGGDGRSFVPLVLALLLSASGYQPASAFAIHPIGAVKTVCAAVKADIIKIKDKVATEAHAVKEAAWNEAVDIGHKAEPILPFLGLVGGVSNIATPVLLGALKFYK